ncbi:MAG TPA: hypothetical protein VMR62_26925 [Bryobacteraceae bacterium]|nr:hypothetical protein [Bryobacteraceae bacterium]
MMVVIGVVLAIAACFVVLPPIGQDPLYHDFSDGRTLYGVPHFWNVISNLPFLLVALYGVKALRSHTAFTEPWERIAYARLLAGTAMGSAGSTYYHLHPNDSRLFWDRLPMTVVFMSLAATTIGERLAMRAGKLLSALLILLGLVAVLYWRYCGDLVQFGSMLAVTLLLGLFPSRAGPIPAGPYEQGDLEIREPTGHEELLAIGSLVPIDWDRIAAARVPLVTVIAIRYQVTANSGNFKKHLNFG